MTLTREIQIWIYENYLYECNEELDSLTRLALFEAQSLCNAERLIGTLPILKSSIFERDLYLGIGRDGKKNSIALAGFEPKYNAIHVGRIIVHSAYWLCCSAWLSKDFLADVGNSHRESLQIQPTAIPPGLELVWWWTNAEAFDSIPLLQPTWIKTVKQIDRQRYSLALHSFRAAISYVWLHELAHFELGHVSYSPLDMLNSTRESEVRSKIIQAQEIEADRCAMLRIFSNRRYLFRTGKIAIAEMAATIAGIALTHILFHALRLLNAPNDPVDHHPPLWFRTDEILRIERIAAHANNHKSFKDATSNRIQEECFFLRTLLDLSHVNPLYGDWLGPVIDNSRAIAGKNILENARIVLSNHRADSLGCSQNGRYDIP